MKSFIIYEDWAILLSGLNDRDSGQLIKAICAEKLGKEFTIKSQNVKAMFDMIEPQLKKDDIKYESKVERAKKARESKIKSVMKSSLNKDEVKPNIKSKDKDIDIDISFTNVKDNKRNIKEKSPSFLDAEKVIEYLNKIVGTHYRKIESTMQPIIARLNEGFTVDDCIKVIDNKSKDWLNNPDMAKYLRPETLFAKSKFEGYLNEPEAKRKATIVMPVTEYPNVPQEKASAETIAAFKKMQGEYSE